RSALMLALVFAAVSLSIASALGRTSFAFALTVLAISALYSARLKDTVLIGNAAIALLDASIVVYAALIAGNISRSVWIASILTFLFMFAQEVLYTARDVEGDSAGGVTTISTQYGVRTAVRLFQALALLFLLFAL